MSTREFADGDRSLEAMTHRDYMRQVARMSDRLRDTADRIDRRGANVMLRGVPCYISSLADVLHELDTMHGNLPTDRLVDTAGAAEAALTPASLAVVREQRDALERQIGETSNAPEAPCGDGRCYCGGCVL